MPNINIKTLKQGTSQMHFQALLYISHCTVQLHHWSKHSLHSLVFIMAITLFLPLNLIHLKQNTELSILCSMATTTSVNEK